jgi:hypothetical protein
VVGPAAAQARDTPGQVVLGVERVGVHARDEGATRAGKPDVEPHRGAAARILEDAHALVLALQLVQDLRRPILGVAVYEKELDRAVKALGQHLAGDLTNVLLLVEDGRKDAHVNHDSPER